MSTTFTSASTASAAAGTPTPSATRSGLRLLEAGIPLTLLIDLLTPGGPDSRAILDDERHAEPHRLSATG